MSTKVSFFTPWVWKSFVSQAHWKMSWSAFSWNFLRELYQHNNWKLLIGARTETHFQSRDVSNIRISSSFISVIDLSDPIVAGWDRKYLWCILMNVAKFHPNRMYRDKDFVKSGHFALQMSQNLPDTSKISERCPPYWFMGESAGRSFVGFWSDGIPNKGENQRARLGLGETIRWRRKQWRHTATESMVCLSQRKICPVGNCAF